MQASFAVSEANLALSAWASRAFCFLKSAAAGAADAKVARERRTKVANFAENMMFVCVLCELGVLREDEQRSRGICRS